MNTTSRRWSEKKSITKPISLAEYQTISDLCFSLCLGQAVAAYGADKARWRLPNAKCVEVAAFTAALLLQKPFKKRFRKIHIRQVEYLAVLEHPEHPDATQLAFWAGNPAVFRDKVPPEIADRLVDMPEAFHVAVVAEDMAGRQWLIDAAGAAEAYHGALATDVISRPWPEGEYALGVCLLQGGPPLVIGRISDVSNDVRNYMFKPLMQDLAAAAIAWHQRPRESMTAVDEHGSISVIEWRHDAFWSAASTELPGNLFVLNLGVKPPDGAAP